MTLDVYGHLFPSGKDSVKEAQSAALAQATTRNVVPLERQDEVAA